MPTGHVFGHVNGDMPTNRQRQKLEITVMVKSHTRKEKLFQTTETTTRLYTRPLLSRRILRGVVSLTLRTQRGRSGTKEQTFRKFNMRTKPQSN